MGIAVEERRQLAELFTEVGPDAPTLCGDWKTRDLAAHLALRERRPDAAFGILLRALAGHTAKVQAGLAAKPWAELVELVRTGPPLYSPYRVPALNELVNGPEFFVHHEDVRRALPGWEPRPADPRRDQALWNSVRKVGRLTFRRSPVGVTLRRPDGTEAVVRRGSNPVTVLGAPGELLMHAFGRSEALIGYEGDQRAIAVVDGLDRSL